MLRELMMRVIVRFLGSIADSIGKKEERFELDEKACLRDLVAVLAEKYRIFEGAEESALSKGLIFIVNGRSIYLLKGMETDLTEGTRITIIPAYAGG